jgi:hypothetical protein
MSHAGGVLGTLPGHRERIIGNEECEECGAPATCRLQGETDSMGAEWYTLCTKCADASSGWSPDGKCDTCKKETGKLVPSRCWEEGPSGPVYWVCEDCLARDIQAAAEADRDMREMMAEEDPVNWEEVDWVEEPQEENSRNGLGELHAKVRWPDYRAARQLLPTLRVVLTRPFEDLPTGTRLTLRLNDYGNRRIRRSWRMALPGRRVLATDLQLLDGHTLTAGCELWALYLDPER